MDSTYNEFSGTDLDLDADMDYDDGGNDLIPILGISAAIAAVVGGILVIAGRRRKPTPQERIQDMFENVGKEGGKRAKTVAKAVGKVDLGDLLSEALDKAKGAADNFDLGGTVGDVSKRARKMTKDVDLSSMLQDAIDHVGDAATFARHRADEAATFTRHRADDARKGVSKASQNISMPDVDSKDVGNFLESLMEKVTGVIETVRSEAVPKATEAIKETVIPAAQDAVDKVREDVLPEVQKRAGQFADDAELSKRARTIGRTAGKGAGTLAEMARGLALGAIERVVQDYLPGAQKASGKAFETVRDDFAPAAGRRAGRAADMLGELAQQAPGLLSDLLGSARGKAQDAADKAGPLAADAATFTQHRATEAATFTGHRAGEAFTFGKHRISDVASSVGDHRNGVGKGIGKAASSAGQGVKGVVGGALGGASHLTRETTRILFWLSLLGGIILFVFVPDKDRQKEIVNDIFQFFNEVREMWTDLQGPQDEPDTATDS